MECFGVHTVSFPFFANNDFPLIDHDWPRSNESLFNGMVHSSEYDGRIDHHGFCLPSGQGS